MRALVVVPLLLCAVLGVKQATAEVTAVKLCGREFLRAVVYTCGGSRWRRFLGEPQLDDAPAEDQGSDESLGGSVGAEVARRDINTRLTQMCCQLGCRKSDLSFLC